MMAKQTGTKTRKNHFYIGCWGYGIGVTDTNGNPFVRVLVFDNSKSARDYANRYAFVDGNSYAKELDARGAVALMRKQLTAKLQSMVVDSDDRAEIAGNVRRMNTARLVEEYRTYVFR